MITVPELAADALGSFLANYMQRRYGSTESGLSEIVPSIARIAIECIGNSDALYHNVEHTMLVTLAGHDILRGRALHTHMPATDYAHLIIACGRGGEVDPRKSAVADQLLGKGGFAGARAAEHKRGGESSHFGALPSSGDQRIGGTRATMPLRRTSGRSRHGTSP